MSAHPFNHDLRRRRAEEIFFAAVDIPTSDRTAALNKLCEGDSALLAEVVSLLTVHDGNTGILDASPALGVHPSDLEKVAGAALTTPHPKEEGLAPGARFGSYRIEREIGIGGMGFVYIAKQERPRRTVALKLIRRYLATPALLRRFELEADILAKLQHPGIAQIYEAGSADDGHGMRPFIAMELVENGKTLTEFADARKLSTAERLELMVRVCDALHHAHQRGVIHRDLKPGNILVDEHSQPKILDFGVARAQGPDYTGTPMTTLHTNVGQIIGTLPYMSPEQVGGDPAEIDVRSDVYSVGVLLYQLLTGRLPHDVTRRSFTDAARLIRETLPAKLSSINRTLRGDLDTIVGMTLSKERSRRYQSAYDLSEDLRRYLKGEPILARRDSALYILRKSMRRYKSLVAAGVVGILSLIGFVIYAGYQVSITSALAKRETQAKLAATSSADELRATLYSANIGFAQAAYLGSDVERMRRVLSDCPPEMRGWEWRFLHRIADTCAIRFQAFEPAWGAAWLCPTSGLIITYAMSPEVKVWTPAAQRGAADPLLLRIDSPLSHAMLCPDGTKVLLVAHNLDCFMFDTATGKQLWASKVPGPSRWSGTFTPDSSHMVWSSTQDKKLSFINTSTGKIERILPSPLADPYWITFDSTGSLMGVCDASPNAVVVDMATGDVKATLKGHTSACTALTFSRDSKMVATCSTDKTVRVFDLATQAQTQVIRSHGNKVYHVAFSPVKDLIASAGTEGIIYIHDVENGELVQRLYGHAERIVSLRFFSDGRLMTCSRDGSVRIWDNVGQPDVPRISTGGPCAGASVSQDGRTAIVRDLSGSVRVIELPSGIIRQSAKVRSSNRGTDTSISSDGSLFACSDINDVVVMRMSDAQEVARLKVHTGAVVRTAFSRDGALLASTSLDGTIRIFDLASGKVLQTLVPPGNAAQIGICFSSDGSRLASCGDDRLGYIWNTWTGALVRTLRGHKSPVFHVVWGQHDDTVITGGDDGNILVWPSASDVPPRSLVGHNGPVYSLGIAADGTRLVSGGFDNTARVWNLQTGQELLTLRGHTSGVVCVAFSRDGNRIVTAANDSRIMVWDAPLADDRPVKK